MEYKIRLVVQDRSGSISERKFAIDLDGRRAIHWAADDLAALLQSPARHRMLAERFPQPR